MNLSRGRGRTHSIWMTNALIALVITGCGGPSEIEASTSSNGNTLPISEASNKTSSGEQSGFLEAPVPSPVIEPVTGNVSIDSSPVSSVPVPASPNQTLTPTESLSASPTTATQSLSTSVPPTPNQDTPQTYSSATGQANTSPSPELVASDTTTQLSPSSSTGQTPTLSTTTQTTTGSLPPSSSTVTVSSQSCPSKTIGLVPNRTDGKRLTFLWPVALDANPGGEVISTCIRISDVGSIQTITSSNKAATFSIDGGSFLPGPQAIKEGSEIRIKLSASKIADARVNANIVFDGQLLAAFSIRTKNADRAPQTFRVGALQNYKTLNELTAILRAGDVVEVDSGIYPEVVMTRSGATDAPITVRGVGPTRPIFRGGVVTVDLKSTHNLILDNIEIAGGTEVCLRTQAHNIILRNSFIRDCPSHGILGSDYGSGSLTIDRVEVTRAGGMPAGAAFKHAIYVATDRDAFPNSTLRIQHSYIHNYKGNAIKSRAARTEIYYNWINGQDHPETLYNMELIGFQAYYHHKDTLTSDVVGNVVISQNIYSTRLGGDGSGASRGRVRLANNTFVLGEKFASVTPVIRLYGILDSAYLVDNAFIRSNSAGTPIRLFRDDLSTQGIWISGRIKLAGKNNYMPPNSSFAPATNTEFVATTYGIGGTVNTSSIAFDASLASGSMLLGTGSTEGSMPAGYEIPSPLLNLTLRSMAQAPAQEGSSLPVYQRVTQSKNIGAQ